MTVQHPKLWWRSKRVQLALLAFWTDAVKVAWEVFQRLPDHVSPPAIVAEVTSFEWFQLANLAAVCFFAIWAGKAPIIPPSRRGKGGENVQVSAVQDGQG